MKFKLLILMFALAVGGIFAQSKYPLVSIHDIQFIDSVGTKGFINSPLLNDTVRVRGTIMVRPVVDPDTNRATIMYYGARWGTYIQDTSGQFWGGLNILQNDTASTGVQNTFFDLVDTSDIVELTGVVTPYNQTNELFILLNPVTPVNIIGKLPKRPDPIQVSITDFMNGGVSLNDAFKYSGMYVEFHNVISSDRNASNGQFRINDGNGNYLIVYPQSKYFREDANKMPGSTYQPPQDGTPVTSVRGIISYFGGIYELLPLYPNDLKITLTPPVISNLTRSPVQLNTNQTATINVKITRTSGAVTGVQLHYRIGSQTRSVVSMTKSVSDTTIYTATISGISQDSTMVDYYVNAADNLGLTSYIPSDTVKGNYFYQVQNSTLKIRDVQYSPFGSGFSSYNGYYVTLSGVVTADTSDFPGLYSANYPQRVYMQDGSGPWTGIMIGTLGMHGVDVLKFKKGDNITLTGKIVENFSVTTIDSLTNVVVNSHNNALPASVTVSTGSIGKNASGIVGAEQWESVLINYKNVTVTDENADGNPGPLVSGKNNNYGELFVNDTSGDTRISLQDGNNNYENLWDSTFNSNASKIRILTSSKFSEIQGILYYSFSYYKLCPRKNDDFMGYSLTGVNDITKSIPKTYMLEQNYPNPFNPSTVIRYSIPITSNVTLKIFNILGQEVKTLVSQVKPGGTYQVSFDASRLSSGIYFYSLKAGDYSQVKKMVLLK